jgi:hypothetical protein
MSGRVRGPRWSLVDPVEDPKPCARRGCRRPGGQRSGPRTFLASSNSCAVISPRANRSRSISFGVGCEASWVAVRPVRPRFATAHTTSTISAINRGDADEEQEATSVPAKDADTVHP